MTLDMDIRRAEYVAAFGWHSDTCANPYKDEYEPFVVMDDDNIDYDWQQQQRQPPIDAQAVSMLIDGREESNGQDAFDGVVVPNNNAIDPPDEYAVDVFLWKYSQQHRYAVPIIGDTLAGQPDVTWTMRERVIRWLWRVNSHLEYSLENWCLAVALMDRFLALQPLHPDCLQLIALTAFFIAAKLEEREPPIICELVSLSAAAYSGKQFDWMEKVMLNLLEFNLRPPTTSFFLQHVVELERFSHCWPWPFSHALVHNCLCHSELVTRVMPAQLAHAIFSVVVDCFNADSRIHTYAAARGGPGGSDGSNQTFAVTPTAADTSDADDALLAEYCQRVQVEAVQQMHNYHEAMAAAAAAAAAAASKPVAH